MRIISGQFRGKKFHNSEHLLGLRPTTDKNRESLFNLLTVGKFAKEIDFSLDGANVLDVCCGTGAVAMECLSRGANSAFLIDDNSIHLKLAEKNADLIHAQGQCEFLLCDVNNLKKAPKKFDLVFIDPPYVEDYKMMIKHLVENNWIVRGSLVAIEFASKNTLEAFGLEEFTVLDTRRYGKTSFAFLQLG